jgi:hypothetical protein
VAGRSIRGRYGYSQRSGFKVRYDELVEDGQNKGLYVHESEADPQHPQEREVTPIDNQSLFRPIGPADNNVTRVDYGYQIDVENAGERQELFRAMVFLGGYDASVT